MTFVRLKLIPDKWWYFDVGSSLAKHRWGRYSSNQGHWEWWHWSGLSCFVSHLAKGLFPWNPDSENSLFLECEVIFLGNVCVSNLLNYLFCVRMLQRPALEFFGTIQAKTVARDLFICYSRFVEHYLLSFHLIPMNYYWIFFLADSFSWFSIAAVTSASSW